MQSTLLPTLSAIPAGPLLRIGSRLVPLAEVPIMAILNLTPDSFYAASRIAAGHDAALLTHAEALLMEGAHWLDVGGYSTRPGAAEVTEADELTRVVPAIRALRHAFPAALLSVDTFRAPVAEAALDAGADAVNDVSGGRHDDRMLPLVGRRPGTPYFLMHSRGTPQTMSRLTDYEPQGGLLGALLDYFAERVAAARAAGIADLILDPGFGFAKTVAQSYALLPRLPDLKAVLGLPLLVGVSRKGMTYKPLDLKPEDSLPATTALHALALHYGADLLRVHDVGAARQVVAVSRLARRWYDAVV